jgi:ATP-dependent RNA helicase RhlE
MEVRVTNQPMTPTKPTPDSGFYGLGIAPKLLEALDRQKFLTPTPIQKNAIPVALEGKDMIGIAQTGTGKTLAFGIPMIQNLAKAKGRGLILLPTRELALQVDEELQKIGKDINLRTAVLIGGASMHMQLQSLKKNPHVIVATPGRLIDHLDQRLLKLDDIRVLVLDEADRMLDMGFAPQINKILLSVPKDRQTMLFSATMPPEIVSMTSKYMKLPVRVEIARAGTASERVTQELFMIKKEDKTRLLEKLLGDYRGTVLVFSRTKHGAKKITRAVKAMGHTAAEIHSNRSLAQRRDALEGFKSGKYRVLVATDIAARGIDVKGIELVVNFDLPDNPDDYVHRIGRTGRAGHEGRAISFATPDQGADVRAIERLTRTYLPISKLPELPPARSIPMGHYEDRDDDRSSRYRQSGRGGHGGRGGSGRRSSGSRGGSSSDVPPTREGDFSRKFRVTF